MDCLSADVEVLHVADSLITPVHQREGAAHHSGPKKEGSTALPLFVCVCFCSNPKVGVLSQKACKTPRNGWENPTRESIGMYIRPSRHKYDKRQKPRAKGKKRREGDVRRNKYTMKIHQRGNLFPSSYRKNIVK